MVCQPYILQNKLDYFSNSDVVNVCLFVCQYAVNNLLIPGQIENWIMFFNLKGTSLLSLPEPIKLLVKEFLLERKIEQKQLMYNYKISQEENIKLKHDYTQLKDKETYFMVNGRRIKRFKTLDENKIKNNDIINIFLMED